MPINTVDDLREHLALAAKIELSLIPPYLYAMYSISDQSSEAVRLIRSVAVEEMLHATLATNLLLGIGGSPDFRSPDLLGTYPEPMIHHRPPLTLNLAPCTVDVVRDSFLVIERPEALGALPEEDYYETQGQFYYAIERAFERLDATHDLFGNHQPDRQLSDPSYYGTVEFDAEDSGGLVLIEDLASAVSAIEIVVHQGEGLSDEKWADPDHQELTHYYKFLRLVDGTSPIGDLHPAPLNPRTADFPAAVRPASDLFNAAYRYLYFTLDELFGPVAEKGPLVGWVYTLMSAVLGPLANYLMQQPTGNGGMCRPTFEVFEFSEEPRCGLGELAAMVRQEHPGLADIAGTVAGL